MKTNKIETKKDKLATKKAKAKAKKAKIKGVLALLAFAAIFDGCSTSEPASRLTRGEYGDITVRIENASSNCVHLAIGDAAYASADSEGSTETQTANPSNTVTVDVTARYNDALAAATTASKGVLTQLAGGLESVLGLMASKESGTVAVTKTDGSLALVECKNGQCSFCSDCEAK